MGPKLISNNQPRFHLAIYAAVTLATLAACVFAPRLCGIALTAWPIGDFFLPIWRVC